MVDLASKGIIEKKGNMTIKPPGWLSVKENGRVSKNASREIRLGDLIIKNKKDGRIIKPVHPIHNP